MCVRKPHEPGTIDSHLQSIVCDSKHTFHCEPRGQLHVNPTDLPGHEARGHDLAAHRLEQFLVLSKNSRLVNYHEACPPYDVFPAILFAERPDGRAMVVYLRGQNPCFDVAAQEGAGQMGGWWEVTGEG